MDPQGQQTMSPEERTARLRANLMAAHQAWQSHVADLHGQLQSHLDSPDLSGLSAMVPGLGGSPQPPPSPSGFTAPPLPQGGDIHGLPPGAANDPFAGGSQIAGKPWGMQELEAADLQDGGSTNDNNGDKTGQTAEDRGM